MFCCMQLFHSSQKYRFSFYESDETKLLQPPIRHTGIVLRISFIFSTLCLSCFDISFVLPMAPNLRLISFVSMSFLSTPFHTPKLYHISFHFYSSLRTNLLTLLILYISSRIPFLFRGRGKQETMCV